MVPMSWKTSFRPLVQEPLIRVLLDLDQVRHTDDFVDVGEAHALGFAELYGLDFHHKINHSFTFILYGYCVIRVRFEHTSKTIFRILAQYFCQARDFMVRTGACKLCAFWLLIFEFCTFSPKHPFVHFVHLWLLMHTLPCPCKKAPQLPAVPLHTHSSR